MKNLTPAGKSGCGGRIGAHDAISATRVTVDGSETAAANAYGPPPDHPSTGIDAMPSAFVSDNTAEATSTKDALGRFSALL